MRDRVRLALSSLSFVVAALLLTAVPRGAHSQNNMCRRPCSDGSWTAWFPCNTNPNLPCLGKGGSSRRDDDAFDAVEAARRRAVDVLAQLRREIPSLLQDAAPPALERDLLAFVDQMYVQAAWVLDERRQGLEEDEQHILDIKVEVGGLRRTEQRLIERGAALPQLILDLAAEKRDVEAEVATAESRFNALNSFTTRMQNRSLGTMADLLNWLKVAVPRKVQRIPHDDFIEYGGISASEAYSDVPYQEALAAEALESAIMPRARALSAAREPPPGGMDSKLSAAQGLVSELEQVDALISTHQATLGEWTRAASATRERIAHLKFVQWSAVTTHDYLSAQVQKAQRRSEVLRRNMPVAAQNVARAVAEACILETFRDYVLIPELRAFMRANGITWQFSNKSVAEWRRARKNIDAPRLRITRWEGLKRVIEVQKRTVAMMDHVHAYADATVEMIAHGSNANAIALNREIDRYLGQQQLGLLEDASGGQGPFYRVFKKVMLGY